MNAHKRTWELVSGDEAALIVGRQDTVHLRADSVSCIDGIIMKDPSGKELKAEWKSVKPNEVEIKLPLQEAQPGAVTLLVNQYGLTEPQPVPLQVFSEAGRFDGFSIHAGDDRGTLKGSRLDEVANLTIKNVVFIPGELSSRAGSDELPMVAQDAQAASALKPDHLGSAKLTLRDGRSLALAATIEAPRPRVALIGKSVQPSNAAGDSNIQLSDSGELPQTAALIFSIRTLSPADFTRDDSVDVATGDESSSATLSLTNGGLTLANAQVMLATLNPSKAFGPSTFGPLKFRVTSKGIASDWQPLANLVRLPTLKDLECPATPEIACKLIGGNLFLIEAVSADRDFEHAVSVPDGFLGSALPVPHPSAGPLYIRLRDNPQVVNPTSLMVRQLAPAVDDAGRTEARQSATVADPATNASGKP
jgi:hypothetical protein